ncbi:hypothetical protein MYX76_06930 [Desulfobacterota bacterium AH_259_B03_O07]|nr:hypothetical protein [Desulfobacterota bacterium AH_259_B03_O07]
MLKTNILGSVIVSLILLALVGYAFSIGLTLEWNMYLKLGGLILIIAAIIGIASSGGDKS